MAIQATCPHCSQTYSLADTQIGKKVRCKGCSEGFVVRDSAAGRRPSRQDDDDYEEPRKPRPKKKGMPIGLLVGLGIGAFVLLCCLGGGGVLLYFYNPFVNKVTAENFDKIQYGMTEAEVKDILGRPSDETDLGKGVKSMIWKNSNGVIEAKFYQGKLAGKAGSFNMLKRR
jgi:predicted Zn finger-like uncharacterized protein